MQQKKSVAILAVGSELTCGQILNRNAQWIAQQLSSIGIPCDVHLTVPDERNLILEALGFCASKCSHIMVTGGLGPTTDDFTRELVAQWAQRKLDFDDSSWQQIQKRLNSRGIPLRDAQKQQCYFPMGSRILTNRIGTANGFYLKSDSAEIYVLPGPPKEIEVIWQDFIAEDMRAFAQKIDPVVTVSWDTIGFGESEIAHRVEDVTADCPFEKGYRVHLPYVEVKLFHQVSQQEEAKYWIARIENAIGNCTVLRNGEDAASQFALLCNHVSLRSKFICLIDLTSSGHLYNRIFPFVKSLASDGRLSFEQLGARNLKDRSSENAATLGFQIEKVGPHAACATFVANLQFRKKWIESPYNSPIMRDREALYFAELALLFWCESLKEHFLLDKM